MPAACSFRCARPAQSARARIPLLADVESLERLLAASTETYPGRPDEARSRGAWARRRRAEQPPDRQRALPERPDGRAARLEHLPQDRRPRPSRMPSPSRSTTASPTTRLRKPHGRPLRAKCVPHAPPIGCVRGSQIPAAGDRLMVMSGEFAGRRPAGHRTRRIPGRSPATRRTSGPTSKGSRLPEEERTDVSDTATRTKRIRRQTGVAS